MRLSLIGMSGSGKSYWSKRLAEYGFKRFCCDDLIAAKLLAELTETKGHTISMGRWMGFPYEHQYQERESRYLACEVEVLTEILAYLGSNEGNSREKIVIDTTGSVVYTGEEILGKLCQYTTIVYLSVPSEAQEELLNAYLSNPQPMLWKGIFHKDPHETNEEALTRCYPQLMNERHLLYERYADVTISYYRCRARGFMVQQFLDAVTPSGC
jgi:shikimate kinase